ncbi:hypothetical protein EJ02DRAFT_187820 [Clathrospora elynae]|uniref:Uncharacterized protein n=1 Tax=Clathrospora elynae TaxID=706981 RepID=A0A6A5SY32_9PLEO|nr:hypothetical protein EJ02DRAFT_187820 [Clathrospora elynae]
MSNAFSRVVPEEEPPIPGQLTPVLNIAICQFASMSLNQTRPTDLLQRFPTEIRLMIFEELLRVSPCVVFRGGAKFGPLDLNEFHHDIPVPWQILGTCRQYYEEALPIMYGKNMFAFCTGKSGEPSMFWRFPIKVRLMHYLTNLSIYCRADAPTKEAAKRVAHFIVALSHHAKNLEYLSIVISSDQRFEKACPWDILFCDHPVSKALVTLIKSKTVKHVQIRLHDGAALHPGFAHFLLQQFYKTHIPGDSRSLVFTKSCTCAPDARSLDPEHCTHCGWAIEKKEWKPIAWWAYAAEMEADQERMMELQADLFELGLLPGGDDDEEDDGRGVGPLGGGSPMADTYEENRPAFTAPMLLPGEARAWRSPRVAPVVWSFEQTTILQYFPAKPKGPRSTLDF